MARLVLYTYEQPRGQLAKCGKCGYEASHLTMVDGRCASCASHVKDHEKAVVMDNRTLESSVTRKAVEMRCWSYLGKVPPEIKAMLVGRYVVTDGELPEWLRWNVKRRPLYKAKVRAIRRGQLSGKDQPPSPSRDR